MNWIWIKIKRFWKWGLGILFPVALAAPFLPLFFGVQDPFHYFAEIDADGKVLRVIVIEPEMLLKGNWGDPKNWVETKMDGSLRKNYASRGYTYDKIIDAFVPPKPRADAEFDPTTARWKPANVPVVWPPVTLTR